MDKKPSTKETYDSNFRKYIEPSKVATIPLKDLTAKKIQSWYNELFKNGTTD